MEDGEKAKETKFVDMDELEAPKTVGELFQDNLAGKKII